MLFKKQAIVSLQIPDDFSNRLKENRLRDSIPLYYKDDFIGEIALEVTSKALYQQQIPVIIEGHLKKSKQDVTMQEIKEAYIKIHLTLKWNTMQFKSIQMFRLVQQYMLHYY